MASNWARMRCRMSRRFGQGELWSHASRKMAMIRFSLRALLPIRTIPNPLDLVFGHPRDSLLYRVVRSDQLRTPRIWAQIKTFIGR
jgi:hypothetical protein